MPAWLGFCSGDQPQREPLTGFTVAYLKSASMLNPFLVFEAYVKSSSYMFLK